MLKKFFIAVILVLSLATLSSCGKEEKSKKPQVSEEGMLSIENYMVSLTDKKISHLKETRKLLDHPFKDAIALYGDDYEIFWEGVYVTMQSKGAQCGFRTYVGLEFEEYSWDDVITDFGNCDVMEYLSFREVERIIFDQKGFALTDGITIGMSVEEICHKLKVEGLEYSDSSTYITTEIDDNGDEIEIYTICTQIADVECSVIFKGDVLSSVEILNPSKYVSDKGKDADHGKKTLKKACEFVSKNKLAAFDVADLEYKGKIYSSYYDSWFSSWKFVKGDYEGYEINIEKGKPNRIYVTSSGDGFPFLFWCNGNYVNPILSFLGKWREHSTNRYIDIKAISEEGIVEFDMYAHVGYGQDNMLVKNLTTVIYNMPYSLDECFAAEKEGTPFAGNAQFFDGELYSGFYSYGGEKQYLLDMFFMDMGGGVSYVPTGLGGRVSSSGNVHIPSENPQYTQASSFGYMENFGRDDTNKDSIIQNKSSAGDSIINNYLNKLYDTTDLKYADIDYIYLYDYVFPLNNRTYHVWQSNDKEEPHYLYVDVENQILIKEYEKNLISKHTKELIYKQNTIVSKNMYVTLKYSTMDGKIVVDLGNKKITNSDSFVQSIEVSEQKMETLAGAERFMFFAEVGDRYAFDGYLLFHYGTWGATLHVTDSNIPGFDLGVYYLNSESFFLDPSIGVLALSKDEKEDKYIDDYLDDKVNQSGQETKLVIRDYGGKILGYIYVDAQGKKTVRNFGGKILGYYYPDRDVTTDYGGKILTRGDTASALLFTDKK